MDETRRKLLIEGLVGLEHRRLYYTSPWFHAAIDQLVLMQSFFVDGLALKAAAMDQETESAVRAAEAGTLRSHLTEEMLLRSE